jgi:uncharacterized membrane protein
MVFVIWAVVPVLLTPGFEFEPFAISVCAQNVAIVTSTAFGEEFVFRVVPVMTALALFGRKSIWALLAGAVVAYPFGMWHEWIATMKTCLGVGGVVLTFVYLKFGGAVGKPFNGFVACGSIHGVCNILAMVIANLVTSLTAYG